MPDTEILYRDLTLDELTQKQAAITKRFVELKPIIKEIAELKEDEEWIQLAMVKRRAEHGEPSTEDLWRLMLFTNSKPELHNSLNIWLDRHTTGDQMSMTPDADNERGSSDFYQVPFTLDLSKGVTPELVKDIETINALISTRKRNKVVYRVNLSAHLVVKVDKSNKDALSYIAYSTTEYSGIWSATYGNPPTTIALALEEISEMLEKAKKTVLPDRKVERKKLFGLF